MKVCTCGVIYTDAEWAALRVDGEMAVPADFSECDCSPKPPHRKELVAAAHASSCAGHGYTLTLRTCPHCKSTLADRKGHPDF